MKKCPFCNDDLQIIGVDYMGLDIIGCEVCNWDETSKDNLIKDVEFYI